MEKKPRGFSNSVWILFFELKLVVSSGSLSLSVYLSTHFCFRLHLIQDTRYQRKTMVNSQSVQRHFKFKCSFLFLLLIFIFQRPQRAASCIMCKVYCCIYRRKCVYMFSPSYLELDSLTVLFCIYRTSMKYCGVMKISHDSKSDYLCFVINLVTLVKVKTLSHVLFSQL